MKRKDQILLPNEAKQGNEKENQLLTNREASELEVLEKQDKKILLPPEVRKRLFHLRKKAT